MTYEVLSLVERIISNQYPAFYSVLNGSPPLALDAEERIAGCAFIPTPPLPNVNNYHIAFRKYGIYARHTSLLLARRAIFCYNGCENMKRRQCTLLGWGRDSIVRIRRYRYYEAGKTAVS